MTKFKHWKEIDKKEEKKITRAYQKGWKRSLILKTFGISSNQYIRIVKKLDTEI